MPNKNELEERLNEKPKDTSLDRQPPRTDADKKRLIREEKNRQKREKKTKKENS